MPMKVETTHKLMSGQIVTYLSNSILVINKTNVELFL